MTQDSHVNETSGPETENRSDNRERDHVRSRRIRAMVVILVVAGAVVAVWYYLHRRAYESTDNAFIEGSVVQLSPRAAGQVLRVHVRDNQHVNRGDLLVEIDPSDCEARLSEARARLEDTRARASGAQSGLAVTSTVTDAALIQTNAALGAAHAQVEVLQARLAQGRAGIRAAEANLEQAEARKAAAAAEANRAETDVARYRTLFQKDEVSRQMLDRAEAEARATAANLAASQQLIAGAQAGLAQAKAAQDSTLATLRQTEMQVRQAEGRLKEAQSGPQQVRVRQADVQAVRAQIAQQQAAVRQVELNLSYTRVYAPESGFITRKAVEPGNFVQVGQALMGLVSDRLWVVGNFKETQLQHMRPGQPVSIRVDAYPQLRLRGRVDSIQSGSGARFSLLPPENATGNYVKVVQRVPVKIVFEGPEPSEYTLGPRLSVVPEVKVR